MTGPRLVMIEGVAPGTGKSTPAASLARVLRDGDTPADLLPVDYRARIAAEHNAPEGPEFGRIVHYQEHSQVLRQADLDILRATGWFVIDLDATAPAEDVLGQALAALGLPRSA